MYGCMNEYNMSMNVIYHELWMRMDLQFPLLCRKNALGTGLDQSLTLTRLLDYRLLVYLLGLWSYLHTRNRHQSAPRVCPCSGDSTWACGRFSSWKNDRDREIADRQSRTYSFGWGSRRFLHSCQPWCPAAASASPSPGTGVCTETASWLYPPNSSRAKPNIGTQFTQDHIINNLHRSNIHFI